MKQLKGYRRSRRVLELGWVGVVNEGRGIIMAKFWDEKADLRMH